jgi:hypothetical protein
VSLISISNIEIIVYQYNMIRETSRILLIFDKQDCRSPLRAKNIFVIFVTARHSTQMTDNADLAALIRTIPDYPKPGILFRDVSTLLLDGQGFRSTIDRMAARYRADRRDRSARLCRRGGA